MTPGAATIATLVGLGDALAGADLVLTGEGRFDETSLTGKVVGSLLDAADSAGASVGVVAGQIGGPVPGSVSASVSLAELAGSVEAAQSDPATWLTEAGELLFRRLTRG
ncbi:glycerate kinase [Micromonospora sp. NPDC005299]|uniref:glycerate kinase n=1 Tax=Micromonospora sp. NPDC005299 TaxID=3364231 RepID=UPI0036943678